MVAISVRNDRAGVTSYIRCLGLHKLGYTSLLNLFHSHAINLNELTATWTSIVIKTRASPLYKVNGRIVCIGDGIKIAKEGKKMPAVKKLHQESQSNSKPTYIMGHSCQSIALLAERFSYFFAIPLVSRIHEGLIFPKTKKTTLLDKMAVMLQSLNLSHPAYLVADAYYDSGKLIKTLRVQDVHLVTRARSNAVAYQPAKASTVSCLGRHRVYGDKVKLKNLFKSSKFIQADSPVYGEKGLTLEYYTVDLLWYPVGKVVRFVLVKHPKRGIIILMTTDRTLAAIDIIRLYGLRFKMEVSFKHTVPTLGTYTLLRAKNDTCHFRGYNSTIPSSLRGGGYNLATNRVGKTGSIIAKDIGSQTITLLTSTYPVVNCSRTIGVRYTCTIKIAPLINSWHILLCKNHNPEKGESLTIGDTTKLASTKLANTCRKHYYLFKGRCT